MEVDDTNVVNIHEKFYFLLRWKDETPKSIQSREKTKKKIADTTSSTAGESIKESIENLSKKSQKETMK